MQKEFCLEVQYMNLLAEGLKTVHTFTSELHGISSSSSYRDLEDSVQQKMNQHWHLGVEVFLDQAKDYLVEIRRHDKNEGVVEAIEFSKWLDMKITPLKFIRNKNHGIDHMIHVNHIIKKI